MLSITDLELLRQVGDPLADQTIKELFDSHQKSELNTLMSQLNQNEDVKNIKSSDIIRNYFEESSEIPIEIDQKKIKHAEDFYGLYGPEISMFLLMKSLPETYSCRKGVQVLYRTRRFMKNRDGSLDNFTRRLMETSQFVVNVLESGAFTSTGKAIITGQKVRLMHAAIRYYMVHQKIDEFPEWDSNELGIPINQEDMAGTLCSFSSLIIEGFEKFKIDVSPEHLEGFMHVWEIMGHVMGVKDELIPKTHAEGLKLGHAILSHQEEESLAGKELTNACLEFIHHLVPGTQFDHVINMLMIDMVGEEKGKLLGIPSDTDLIQKVESVLILHGMEDLDAYKDSRHRKLRMLSIFNRALMNGMISYFNDNKQIMYRVPPDLQNNWQLNSPWKKIFATPTLFNRRIKLEKKL